MTPEEYPSWIRELLTQARSEGFSKAREMAAKVCEAEARVFQRGSPQGHVLTNAAASIRAMQEEDR